MNPAIRPERAGDAAAIHSVVEDAFANHPHSDGSEPGIVDRLRAAGALTLSLVAEQDGAIIGHVAFSAVTIGDGTQGWHGLGPVAVAPERQGEGIGGALVKSGLAALRASSARGCVVLGEPEYYGRFGFTHNPALTYPGPPAEYFQAIVFGGPVPTGTVTYHAAFGG